MVLGSHIIISAYGFWLPNDPRGSWSEFVWAWELRRLGPATQVETTRSVAARPHDRGLRLVAKRALKRPAVHFTGLQARAVAHGFAAYAEKVGLRVWACAILPEHAHLVLARHEQTVEYLVPRLKGAATNRLLEEGRHPFGGERPAAGAPPKCWSRGEWKVFLDSDADVLRAIRYVAGNPAREGKSPQTWRFVTPYTPMRV